MTTSVGWAQRTRQRMLRGPLWLQIIAMRSYVASIQFRIDLWANAIRDSLVGLIPLTFTGAIIVMIANVPALSFQEWAQSVLGQSWRADLNLVADVTLGLMGLLCSVSTSLKTSAGLKAIDGQHQITQAAIACAATLAFFLAVLPGSDLQINSLGYASVLVGIVVGICSAELMHLSGRWLPRHEGLSSMEPGVPLKDSIQLAQQAALMLLTLWGIKAAWGNLAEQLDTSALDSLTEAVAEACQSSGSTSWLNILMSLLTQLLWLAGVNGGQVLLGWGMSGSACVAPPSVVYPSSGASIAFMNTFGHMGGAGATWGLILACLLKVKDRSLRTLCWYSTVPAVLNVNELLLFGLPLVFGRPLMVPFLVSPALSISVAMLMVNWLNVPMDVVSVPWSMPVFLSGYAITGSFWGCVVQALGIGLSALIYLPFLTKLESHRAERRKIILQEAVEEIATTATNVKFLERSDNVGDVARGLLRDFQADLGGPRVSVVYQPQHDVLGRVVGVEALLRWNSCEHGLIPTVAIVNLAEECHAIHDIGTWVASQVCSDIARWREVGFQGLKVSINMSPVQLEHRYWCQTLAGALRQHGVASANLGVEITEGRMLSSSVQAEQTLTDLQSLGVPLAMDDFGMGHTSLMYMQRFNVASIKLDGQLTRGVEYNIVNQDIIRAIAGLGHARGVSVVAEFVETAAQRDALVGLGCHFFQGWLYSPAVTAEELPKYVRSHGLVTGASAQVGPGY